MEHYDIVIVGGGPAGLAAAVAAKKQGMDSILIVERDGELGGILNQCIHNGFGLHRFQEELTGPEYAKRFMDEAEELKIDYKLQTTVLRIEKDKTLTLLSKKDGFYQVQAQAVILAMGCRERPRGALGIPGFRPAGIFTAGTAQRLVNIEGYLPGKEVIILGSGDIGLIMARRLTLEGARVKFVAELRSYSSGLKRNIVQCLEDYDIPLLLSHTIVDIQGKERLEGVTLAKVDERGKIIPETEEKHSCDTLLLSVGLIPENELSRELGLVLDSTTHGAVVDENLECSLPGIFACGNVLHVHDLVDRVSEEGERAGTRAAAFVRKRHNIDRQRRVEVIAGTGVHYTVPQYVTADGMKGGLHLCFRVNKVYQNVWLDVCVNDQLFMHKKRRIMVPGEMERIMLSGAILKTLSEIQQIEVSIREEDSCE